jgi:hypothetical protein
VGSVIPTRGAIIPSCVGVDIGCGMVASETTLTSADLPDSLDALMPLVATRVPSGVGKGHDAPVAEDALAQLGRPRTALSARQETTAAVQFGTLGSGNHFAEVCLDERQPRGARSLLDGAGLDVARPAEQLGSDLGGGHDGRPLWCVGRGQGRVRCPAGQALSHGTPGGPPARRTAGRCLSRPAGRRLAGRCRTGAQARRAR